MTRIVVGSFVGVGNRVVHTVTHRFGVVGREQARCEGQAIRAWVAAAVSLVSTASRNGGAG